MKKLFVILINLNSMIHYFKLIISVPQCLINDYQLLIRINFLHYHHYHLNYLLNRYFSNFHYLMQGNFF